jgi:predicted nucleic acid-binding protein
VVLTGEYGGMAGFRHVMDGLHIEAPGDEAGLVFQLVQLCASATDWTFLARLLTERKITGPAVHDARIAALCLANGVRELWSADRDFSRFPDLRTANPLA